MKINRIGIKDPKETALLCVAFFPKHLIPSFVWDINNDLMHTWPFQLKRHRVSENPIEESKGAAVYKATRQKFGIVLKCTLKENK